MTKYKPYEPQREGYRERTIVKSFSDPLFKSQLDGLDYDYLDLECQHAVKLGEIDEQGYENALIEYYKKLEEYNQWRDEETARLRSIFGYGQTLEEMRVKESAKIAHENYLKNYKQYGDSFYPQSFRASGG